ncbi:MAG TPA: radical SAM protein [Desulfatiglandales bacterium]|nr:radical SAM protein [Desulfatiglandales bacterium]
MPFFLKRPLGFFFYLTGRCNLKCTFCWQREDEHRKSAWENSAKSELGPEEWVRIVQSIPKPSFLGLSGGEATISKAFKPVIEAASQRRIPVTVNTNGTLLGSDHIRLLTETSVKNVSISLDGFADVHNKYRGIDGLFNRIVLSIQKLNESRSSKNKPFLTIKTVLLDENVGQLGSFRKFCAKELKAETLNISFMKIGDHAQFSLKYCDDFHRLLREKHSALYPYKDPGRIAQVLIDLLRDNCRSRCKVQLYPQMMKLIQIQNFLEKEGKWTYNPCYLPWTMVVVLPNGEIIPCLSFSLGNVKDYGYDLTGIFGSERYRFFLDEISSFGSNVPTSCNVCCFLKVKNA